MIHKPKCENYDTTTIRISSKSHLRWKKHSLKNPLYFKIFALILKLIMKLNTAKLSKKTVNFCKQNLLCKGYYKVSKLDVFLQIGYFESPVDYNTVDWFVNEILKLENRMAFCFKNRKKDNIMTEEDDEDSRNNNICDFVRKILKLVKREIIVTLQVNTDEQRIANVILIFFKNEVFLYRLYFKSLVTMTVIFFLKG